MSPAADRGASGGLLVVEHLTLRLPGRPAPLLRDVSFAVEPGERVGIVGPSGAGKTMLLLSVLGLPPAGARLEGRVLWRGEDLLRAPRSRLRHLRGGELAMVFQAPAAALHPLHRVDVQVAEARAAHAPGAISRHMGAARRALRQVGLEEAGDGRWPYPHEMSGGECQRALLAMAVANRPALLLADEPTTSLDAVMQARVLALLESLCREVNAALVLVSHDREVVRRSTGRLLHVEDGRLVEAPPRTRVPSAARGRGPASVRRGSRDAGPGGEPVPGAPPGGGPVGVARPEGARPRAPGTGAAPALEVLELRAGYRTPRLLGSDVVREAVAGVSLEVAPGETLALVGPSGAGKSTLARAILQLQRPWSGEVRVAGVRLTGRDRASLRAARRRIQIVFQDPAGSLHPGRPVASQVGRPIRALCGATRRAAARRTAELLEGVALSPELGARLPRELSTGQQQRVSIARALGPDPDVLVLDEPVSSLDADVRADVLALLATLQVGRGTAYLLVSHDLLTVRDVAQRIAVMDAGRIVEEGAVSTLFAEPRHPVTRSLLEAAGSVAGPSAGPGDGSVPA